MKTLNPMGGDHLWNVLQDAVALASQGDDVQFAFNGTIHTVMAFDSFDVAKARVEKLHGWPLLSPEEASRKVSEDLARRAAESAAAITAANAPTEAQMRDAAVPWPKTMDELTAYITALVERPHDYGTCVYAMSMAATAAFYHVASALGTTGFQASCADMDILRRTRGLKHGFRIVSYEDALYPQYWDAERAPIFEAALNGKGGDDLRTAARTNLDGAHKHVHPNVLAHWRRIADWPRTEVSA